MKLAVFALLLVVLPLQASSYVCDTLIVEVMKGSGLPNEGPLNYADGYVKVSCWLSLSLPECNQTYKMEDVGF